jgi:hypothetical protein
MTRASRQWLYARARPRDIAYALSRQHYTAIRMEVANPNASARAETSVFEGVQLHASTWGSVVVAAAAHLRGSGIASAALPPVSKGDVP